VNACQPKPPLRGKNLPPFKEVGEEAWRSGKGERVIFHCSVDDFGWCFKLGEQKEKEER